MGFWTLIPAAKFCVVMTSCSGGTADSKSAGGLNLGISQNSATERDRETKLVSKCAEGSISYTLLRDFTAVF